ncbi:MAG: hypothetical protein R2684_06715 [Pyrinomonadaceae bacterium]
MSNQENEQIKRHSCQNCAADMVFDPAVGKLLCPYCDAQKTIAVNLADVVEQDFETFLKKGGLELQPIASNALQITCNSCGATVTFIPPTTASSCDFCGAKLVAQPKAADPLVAPEGVLPFSVTSSDAQKALSNWTSSRWFAPSALKTMATQDKADSVYVPYWTFDAASWTDYTGQRGDDYQDTEYYTDSEGNQQSRTVTKTNWSYASGSVSRDFDDVPVPASTSVLPEYISRLNWDFENLVSYDPGYLSGHLAQTYQVTLEEGYERFKTIADGIIRGDVRSDIGGDKQSIDSMSTAFSKVTFKHVLMPVYAGAYKFNAKTFQIVINGRTGEVYGERPYSALKIGCLVIFIAFVLLFIILLIGLLSR